jgi:hypothetical protein
MYPSLNIVYSKLPRITGATELISAQQTTNDIMNAVLKQHKINVHQADRIASLFDTGDDYSTCQKIWNFLKYEIPYKVEPSSKQTAKTLSRILHDAKNGTGKNDCKHYSNFTAAILDCLGIPFVYRFAGYSKYSNLPTHVYVVAKPNTDKIIIDAVLNDFDTEKPYQVKIDKKMALYKLSGIDGDEIMIGGVWKKVKNTAKKVGRSVKSAAKTVAKVANTVKEKAFTASFAVPRNAFLLLLRFNVHGWATGLKNKKFNELLWWRDWFGGDRTELMNVIKQGASRKRILGIENDMLYDPNTIGLEPVSTSAALASAAPIITKVSSILSAAEKVSNKVEKITAPVNKTIQAVNTAKNGFEKTTGIKVEDIIYKKDAGKSTSQVIFNKSNLGKPTDAEALKIAQAAVQQRGGIDNKKLMLYGGAALIAALVIMKRK